MTSYCCAPFLGPLELARDCVDAEAVLLPMMSYMSAPARMRRETGALVVLPSSSVVAFRCVSKLAFG